MAASSWDASSLDSSAIFESRRTGVTLQRDPGSRTRISIFYEIGEDESSSVASDEITRLDDLRSYGVNLRLQLSPRLRLNLGYIDSRRDSSNPAFDRDLRTLISSVSLGSDLLTW